MKGSSSSSSAASSVSSPPWTVSYTFAPHHKIWEKAAAAAESKLTAQDIDEKKKQQPPAPASTLLPSSFRTDLDMTSQLMDVKSHHLDKHEEWSDKMYNANLARPSNSKREKCTTTTSSSSLSGGGDEMIFLKLMVIEAVGRQKHFNSSALSARVSGEATVKQEREEEALQRKYTQGHHSSDRQERKEDEEKVRANRAKSKMYVEKAFDLDFVGKTLLADIETVYLRYGYKTTLDGLKNLRLWDLS